MFTAVQKWAPSITWGNTIVHKPSPYTPLTGQRVAELLADVFPKGVFNFVSGNDQEGHNVGVHLVNSPSIRKVSFTGSVNTGKAIMAASANDVKRVTLELGGNDPAIIRPDVDIAQVAPEGEHPSLISRRVRPLARHASLSFLPSFALLLLLRV